MGKRLALVGLRQREVMETWFASAQKLGIELTVIGMPNTWLHKDSTPVRYIAANLEPGRDLSQRIFEIVSQDEIGFDGVCTFTDIYMEPVGIAAQRLGLPTDPPSSVVLCCDKNATRNLDKTLSSPICVQSAQELELLLQQPQFKLPKPPLFVKPSRGWASQGVSKVDTTNELLDFLRMLDQDSRYDGLGRVIDTYIDGPEIDANFAMLNGELVHFNIVDGFPCTAELPSDSTRRGNFMETDQLLPSAHPLSEQLAIRDQYLPILRELGLVNGIYHLEARLCNSTMHYAVNEDGILDLVPHNQDVSGLPYGFLLEINKRPPGSAGLHGTKAALGIDYTALHMLAALGDKQRFLAAAQSPPNHTAPFTDAVFINATYGGVYDGGILMDVLRDKRPDVVNEIVHSATFYKRGEKTHLDTPRIALFVISSTKSRKHVLQIAKIIREVVQPAVKIIG